MIAILTEANQEVATGHLMEAIDLANEFIQNNEDIDFYINNNCPEDLKKRIPCKYICYTDENKLKMNEISNFLKESEADILVTDLRKLENDDLWEIKNYFHGTIISIDEWGHRRLDADIIINPMVSPYYWEYEIPMKTKVFCGAKYLILSKKIRRYAKKKKEIREKIERVCISMGGVDQKGTTLKLATWIPSILPDAEMEIIVGAGFPYYEELVEIISNSILNNRTEISVNVSDIYNHFASADLAFCAGGNTLHELACLGIPTIVIPTMPHEKENGNCFENKGFGICLSEAEYISQEEVADGITFLQGCERRKEMATRGKEIQDGRGVDRLYDICLKRRAEI